MFRRFYMKKRYRLKNKSRFFSFVIVILVILISLISFTTSLGKTNEVFTVIEVMRGDTLWKIASKYNFTNQDIRSLIYEIETINEIDSALLVPGMKLKIPTN
jgi:hypothetical protein